MVQGACLCGALKYEVGGPFNLMAHCHCSMCRKSHGVGFATYVAAPLESFKWISGEENITSYQSSAKSVRRFCRTCGSVAPLLAPEMGLAILPVGNLEGELNATPEMHMFVGSKASWHEILDDLPRHESWPPQFAGEAVQRSAPPRKADAHTGGCLCGDVEFEVTGAPVRVYSCHCTRCRRAKSAVHGTNAFFYADQFRWTKGESHVVAFKLPEARFFTVTFCKRCGSSLPVVSPARGFAMVPAGSLDDMPPEMPTIAHIFVADKLPWFNIPSNVPQHEQLPPPPFIPPRAT